jgi:hypothetical protein
VEDEFVRRRGKHLLISPVDWALVESWKDSGIPLAVVMRGITQAFDQYDARPNRFQKVNSLLYCQQAVEESYAEYRLSQVGGGPAPPDDATQDKDIRGGARKQRRASSAEAMGFSRESLTEFVERCSTDLAAAADRLDTRLDNRLDTGPSASSAGPRGAYTGAAVRDTICRARVRLTQIRDNLATLSAISAQAIESDLDSLDRMLMESLILNLYHKEDLEQLKKEAKAQLRTYKKKMEKTIYDQTVDNLVARRIRETHHIPRLSLFYM